MNEGFILEYSLYHINSFPILFFIFCDVLFWGKRFPKEATEGQEIGFRICGSLGEVRLVIQGLGCTS